MRDVAPSRDCRARRVRGGLIGEEYLRHSDSGMRAKFRAARVESGGETRGRNRKLRREWPRVKVDIAQEPVFSERIVVVENFDELADLSADFFGLVGDLRGTSRKS